MNVYYNNKIINIDKALKNMKLGDILYGIPLNFELYNWLLAKAIFLRNDPKLKYVIVEKYGYCLISN
jgi:hypothetical protein